jgi:4,4'-diaponeurosporenoate glycosyltransferase
VEDVELGLRLARAGKPGTLFIGDAGLTYRMYPDGPRALFEGWVKNMAAGASGTQPLALILVILWVTSAFSVTIRLVQAAASGNAPWLAVYALLYAAWALTLSRTAAKFGRFAPWATLLFPLPMAAFASIFLVSLVKKLLRLPVTWKGRKIGPGGGS